MVLATPPGPQVLVPVPVGHVSQPIPLTIYVLASVQVTIGPPELSLSVHQVHQDLPGVPAEGGAGWSGPPGPTLPVHRATPSNHPKPGQHWGPLQGRPTGPPPLAGVVGPSKLIIGQVNDVPLAVGLAVHHLPLVPVDSEPVH